MENDALLLESKNKLFFSLLDSLRFKNTVLRTKLIAAFSKDVCWMIGCYAFQAKITYPGFLVAQIAWEKFGE